MFGTDYVRKEAKMLDKIVDTLNKLDESMDKLQDVDTMGQRHHEERKALREIETFLKQTGKLEDLQDKKYEYDAYGDTEDYARQNQALRDITAACDRIHDSLQVLDTEELSTEEYDKLEEAMVNIRQILRSVGRYDNYAEDANDRYEEYNIVDPSLTR